MTTTASARGTANRRKGNSFEADLARYLRAWWPAACRAVRTGSSAAPDPGDIANVAGVVISAKNVSAATASWPSTWARWWSEVDAMLAEDPAALAVIVEKRRGTADVAAAWAHLHLSDLVALAGGDRPGTGERDRTPVRLRLDDLVGLLAAAGYARGAA